MKTHSYTVFFTLFLLVLAGCNEAGPNLVDGIFGGGAPSITASSTHRLFPTPLEQGEAWVVSFVDSNRGSNQGMAYTCTFDRFIDGVVTAGDDCSLLPGWPLTTFGDGTLTWTPDKSAWGSFELAVNGTNAFGSGQVIIPVSVRPGYSTAHLRGDWSALFADGIHPSTDSSLVWRDLTTNGFDGTHSDTAHASWVGTGLHTNPLAVAYDGLGNTAFGGNVLENQTKMMVQTWMAPSSVTTQGAIVVGTSGSGAGRGFAIRQSRSQTNQYEFVVGQTYQDVIFADNPIGYWRLNESAGPTAYDISGHNHNGTYTGGGFTFSQTNALTTDSSSATLFNGTSSHVVIPGHVDFQVNNLVTISMWIRPTTLALRRPLYSNRAVAGVGDFNFEAGVGNGGTARLNLVTPGVWNAETFNGALATGTWQHVAYTRNGAVLGNQRLYINGVSQPLGAEAMVAFSNNLNNQLIGFDPVAANYFSGVIAEVAVFNFALGPDRILAQYQAGLGMFGGICYSTSAFTNNQWKLLGGLFDGTTASFFVNGAQECTVSAPPVLTPPEEDLSAASTVASENPWQGRIADLRVYGTSDGTAVGTASDHFTIFEGTADRFREFPVGGLITSGLVLHADAANADRLAPFANGCAAATLSWLDLSSALASGTLTGFAGCGATSGWLGTGATSDPYRLKFDGTNDLVDFPHSTALNLASTLSVGMWIRSNTLATHPNADLGTKAGWWNLSIGTPSAGLIRLNDGGTNGRHTAAALSNGTWNHVMAVKSGSGLDSVSIYINATPVTTAQTGTSWAGATGSTVTTLGGGANGYFNGDIAHFTAYNRALSAAEVRRSCQATQARFAGATCN